MVVKRPQRAAAGLKRFSEPHVEDREKVMPDRDWWRDNFALGYTNGENWDATGIGAVNSTNEEAHHALMSGAMTDEGLDPTNADDCADFVDGQTAEADARGCDRVAAYGVEDVPFREQG
jgi:hypothetical protein